MFIREINKKNPGSDKIYTYHRLMESVRTPRGPRQRTLLNLGELKLPRDQWKALANRIEEIVTGQGALYPVPETLEELARQYAQELRQKEIRAGAMIEEHPAADYETVDLHSLSCHESRSVGGEAVALNAFNQLQLPEILTDMGFDDSSLPKAALLIIGRLLYPASERATLVWGQEMSALSELLETDFQQISSNALYRISDRLLEQKAEIEARLSARERDLFGLGEKILLYDLTNTYLEGSGAGSEKAHFGHSKEKRSDCPLITLSLVLDEDGFSKASRVFPGNVSEPATLRNILETLEAERQQRADLFSPRPTLIIDAGVATEDNLKLITAAGFHYVTVNRRRPKEIPTTGLLVIKDDAKAKVEVKKIEADGETILYCQSQGRLKKEEAIKTRLQKRFEEGLAAIAASLKKKGGLKAYPKVLERLGRLRQKYPSINLFYDIEVKENQGLATDIIWQIPDQSGLKARFAGAYYLRSSRTDLSEKELWSLYNTLTNVEDAFRSLKGELGLRPVYHRKDARIEGHLFITVLAYHLLVAIQRRLREAGLHFRWQTIRRRMATQTRVTAAMTNNQGQRIHIRQTTQPEPFHMAVHKAVNSNPRPGKIVKMKM